MYFYLKIFKLLGSNFVEITADTQKKLSRTISTAVCAKCRLIGQKFVAVPYEEVYDAVLVPTFKTPKHPRLFLKISETKLTIS